MTFVVVRQGDVESAMKYLEMFVELADRSQQLPEQQKACTCLGAIYNSLVCQWTRITHLCHQFLRCVYTSNCSKFCRQLVFAKRQVKCRLDFKVQPSSCLCFALD